MLWLLSPCGRGLATHLTVEVAMTWLLLGRQIAIPEVAQVLCAYSARSSMS